jgi:hypothetical protein
MPEQGRGVSPLHDMLGEMPDLFAVKVLAGIDSVDCAVLA